MQIKIAANKIPTSTIGCQVKLFRALTFFGVILVEINVIAIKKINSNNSLVRTGILKSIKAVPKLKPERIPTSS